MAGASDRDIVRQLEEDPEQSIKVTAKTVNLDWHRALKELVTEEQEEAKRLRTLMAARLERLFMGQWIPATASRPVLASVEMCRRLIEDMRAMYGLDTELGDADRPINVEGDIRVDIQGLSDADLDALLAIAEKQAIPGGEAPAGPGGAPG